MPGPGIPRDFPKRNGWEEKSEEGPGRGEKPPFSPSLTAAVPAVRAGLGSLWGRNILLPVLGGRGRACPLANLDGEEETKACFGPPHGPLLREECPWKLPWALCTPSLRRPLPCLWVTLALKPPEHTAGAVTGLPQDWKTSLKVVVPARWGYGKCSGTSPTSPTVTLTILGQSDARLVIVTLMQKNKNEKNKRNKKPKSSFI